MKNNKVRKVKSMPKDATIKKWMNSYQSKKAFEKEINNRLEVLQEEYQRKKSKLNYILKRLYNL